MCNLECWRFSSFLLVIAIFNLHGFCRSEKAPNYTFVKEAISAAPISYYDYIIIGGGTSGCPLAATLSQKANVLVLERGGSPYEKPNMTDVGNFLNTLLDNSPSSPSQWFISEDGVYNARARVLGGGSVLNAGFYSRATDDDVKRAGWDEALVKDSYEWVEKKVAFEPLVLQWQSAVRDGLLEAGVLPYNGFTYDHIFGTKVGGTIFDRDGHRHTAANLLEYADPKKITVYLHATVERILFTTNGRRPKADCVTFKDALGLMHKACLINNSEKNEIILSAGAIGSPQLLMLSGVGPANQLRSHGINVVVDQPLVGQGMSDNPMNALLIPSPLPVEVSLAQVVGITRFGSYIESLSGLSFDSSWAKKLSEDYVLLTNQTAGRPSMVIPEAMASAFDTVQSFLNGTLRAGIIGEKVMDPISSGYLELRSTNVDDNPSVTFNYFQEPEDLQKCVRGMRTIIDVVNSKSLSKFHYSNTPAEGLINLMVSLPINLRPRHINSAISLEQFCNDTVLTIWHYHGGCQVGRVVDNDYKVLGMDALRVIDGSTFLNSPGTNPQATVMMLGRYMGLRILNER